MRAPRLYKYMCVYIRIHMHMLAYVQYMCETTTQRHQFYKLNKLKHVSNTCRCAIKCRYAFAFSQTTQTKSKKFTHTYTIHISFKHAIASLWYSIHGVVIAVDKLN